jgi:hypothetical protein
MVHYSLVLAGLFSASTLSAAVPAPQPEATGIYTIPTGGLANGMYDVDLNEDGTTRFTLVDVANTTSTIYGGEALESRDLVARAEGAGCGTRVLNYNDLGQSQNTWKIFCGSGVKWYGRSKAFAYNNVVAYGCTYGGDQGCNKDYIGDFYNKIAQKCGSILEGFYSYPKNGVGYGYTVNGRTFFK